MEAGVILIEHDDLLSQGSNNNTLWLVERRGRMENSFLLRVRLMPSPLPQGASKTRLQVLGDSREVAR